MTIIVDSHVWMTSPSAGHAVHKLKMNKVAQLFLMQ